MRWRHVVLVTLTNEVKVRGTQWEFEVMVLISIALCCLPNMCG